ncbi:MAG: TolC family protein [Gammaproteobacteria bacterium]|nr:TolC family protein [Gammaproteobacteria bacterium]
MILIYTWVSKLKNISVFLSILLYLLSSPCVLSLTIDEYLSQVKTNNDDYKSAQLSTQSGFDRSNEGFLSLSPNLISSANYLMDNQNGFNRHSSGSKTVNEDLRVGIAKKFSTGTNIKAEYNTSYTETFYTNTPNNKDTKSWYTRPIIGIQQSLLRNWLGSETQALIDLKNAQAKAQGHMSEFNRKKLLADAETVYWDLATVVANVQIKQDSVQRSQRLVKWAQRRSKSGLGNDSDYLQAKSALQQRKFELEAILDFQKSKARLFNSYRTILSEDIPDKLESFENANIANIKIKSTDSLSAPNSREDLKAQYQNYLSSKAQADIATENIRPDLNFNLQYFPSGRDYHYAQATNAVWRGRNPNLTVGLNFSIPLDRGLIKDLNGAYKAQTHAAKLAYTRKQFELTNEWQRLSEQITLFNKQLKISKSLVTTQLKKLHNEEELLKNGRTTTFQVLQFEEDYFNAQSQYLDTKNNLLKLTTMSKLFD